MMDILNQWIPNLIQLMPQFIESNIQTLIMIVFCGFVSLVFGILFGVILVVTRPGDILENKIIYIVLGKIIDLFRAVPGVILIMILRDVTKFVSGTYIGFQGSLFPLIVGTVPFFARQIEQAIAEVDQGLVEASEAMGLTPFQIIIRVYLRESIPSIIRGTSITLIALIGLTAVVGTIGGGGVGAFCYNYGFTKNQFDVMWACVISLVLMTIIIQSIGNYLARKTTH
ncbi:methionine ABC transporter permease [Merdibacter massiliensis]|uniref:methionine ABC transporter permease n=1 Tax=Merdibacter massiliensis TaxID=1871030 RepID=UPI00096A7959|nr:methionine ABC transporter permease [Merdibacter massiliensis]